MDGQENEHVTTPRGVGDPLLFSQTVDSIPQYFFCTSDAGLLARSQYSFISEDRVPCERCIEDRVETRVGPDVLDNIKFLVLDRNRTTNPGMLYR